MESATEITIQPCTKAHVVVYGKIYAEAFCCHSVERYAESSHSIRFSNVSMRYGNSG